MPQLITRLEIGNFLLHASSQDMLELSTIPLDYLMNFQKKSERKLLDYLTKMVIIYYDIKRMTYAQINGTNTTMTSNISSMFK